jgi:hypothetical protein
MSDKWKASLPGIFSIAFLAVFLLAKLVTGVPFAAVEFVKVVLIGLAAWFGFAWVPPQLPARARRSSG